MPIQGSDWRPRFRLCGAFWKTAGDWLAYQSQRHITPNATEEILCGPPHKISQSHSNPSGSFDTDRHSIGSTNDASVLGNESRRDRVSRPIFMRPLPTSLA